jgi:hypothetical protein
LTWRAGTTVLPSTDQAVFVVNPSLEAATLLDHPDHGWLLWTVQSFTDAGLAPRMTADEMVPLPGLAAAVDCGRITVTLTVPTLTVPWADVPLTAPAERRLRRDGTTMVLVATLLDPAAGGLADARLRAVLEDGTVALGTAQATFTRAAQAMDGSDFDHQTTVQMVALAAEAIRRSLGDVLTDVQLGAPLALLGGKDEVLRLLRGRDRILAMLPLIMMYRRRSADLVVRSASTSRPQLVSRPTGGTHIVTRDEEGTQKWAALLWPVARELHMSFGLADGSDRNADIILGTADQFNTAGDTSRAELAVLTDGDPGRLAAEPWLRRHSRLVIA